jgi:twinkle protein
VPPNGTHQVPHPVPASRARRALFYLDHLTALAAAEDDERTALERITSEMAMLAKELQIVIHFVSHLATPEGKPHEEGGRVMIRHFKGSRAIGFWSHYMIGLERDQQAADETERQRTTVRLLKARFDGSKTGSTFFLGYDTTTGRLAEVAATSDEGFEDETKEKEF